MSSFNKVMLMGNVTRDPQTKQIGSGGVVAEFGIAVNHHWTGKDGTKREESTFVDCTAWGRTGEVIAQYFAKGKPIFIEGRLKYETWDDKNGGGKRSKLSVVVESFQFVGGNDGKGDGQPRPTGQRQPAQRAAQPDMTAGEFKDDDIPF